MMDVARTSHTSDDVQPKAQPSLLMGKVGLLLCWATLLFALGITIFSAVMAVRWYERPFIGFIFSSNGLVHGAKPLSDTPWAGLTAGLHPNDVIQKLSWIGENGQVVQHELNTVEEKGKFINTLLAQQRVGQPITIQVLRPSAKEGEDSNCSNFTMDGADCSFTYKLSKFPLADFALQFGLSFAVSIVVWIIGFLILVKKPYLMPSRLIAVLCAIGMVIILGRFETITEFHLEFLTIICLIVVGGFMPLLALIFPYPLSRINTQTISRYLILTIIGVFALTTLIRAYNPTEQYYDFMQLMSVFVAVLGFLAAIAIYIMRYRTAISPILREQLAVVLVGIGIATSPVVLWLGTVLLERVFGLTWLTFSSVYLMPPLIAIPLAFYYTIVYERNPQTDKILNEAAIYSMLIFMVVIGYMLVVGATYILTQGVIQPNNPLFIAITLFLIAVAFSPLRLRLEEIINESFFRQRRRYDQRLERFSRLMTTAIDVDDVVKVVKKELLEGLNVEYAFIFLRSPTSGDFEAVHDPDTGTTMTDIRFRSDSGLVRFFEEGSAIAKLNLNEESPVRLASDRSRLAVLNTPLIMRMRSPRRMNGFIALGPRQNKQDFGFDEMRYAQNIADQAAAAFERLQIVHDAQRNERELKVLSQVSAALNIVMDFDTLLEFVYTQVNKVIPTDNFYIVLSDAQTDELYYVFYQDNGERLLEKEGLRWPIGRDLYSEVMNSRQPQKTDNYVQYTQRNAPTMRIDNTALRAWMGVPLNAGEGKQLGVVALGSNNPQVSYSTDQARIFWDIASLAATSIYKTQLYTESETRGRQMKALNDVSSKLATVFEDVDALLKIITESAVEILNCEAGSLLLRDEQANELVFATAIGGSDAALLGKRIPANSGIAGTVVQSGRHAIVRDVQQDNRWYGEVGDTNARKMFRTNSILAVPLIGNAGVIGVLEVINKKDGTNFDEQDVNLLTTFSGQAAIAIDNARLYQRTDEQLALRVQQLGNMQRIDQELNSSLDLNRIVSLAVEFALDESKADAGALFFVHGEPPTFKVVASSGYPQDRLCVGEVLPLTRNTISSVYERREPLLAVQDRIVLDSEHPTLPNVQAQLAVPFIAGDRVTAILLLESAHEEAFTLLTLSQIEALADHANTAVTNAQLYTQLSGANEARMEFIRFVSHELKNPMTSIRGYAEALFMTGQLSDQQKGFVTTIRSNVARMQQIVDDLRDLAAQESGKLSLTVKPTSFNTVVLETLRGQQRILDDKQQQVHLNVPENLPLVMGDELRLIQVMTNFLSNAHKYTPAGGQITITAYPIANPDNATQQVMYCSIADNGIGMSEADLKKLFTPYWRSDNERAREQVGTGLGMTLTKSLIEAHGGKVWVESEPDKGTTFYFIIPLVSEVETQKS